MEAQQVIILLLLYLCCQEIEQPVEVGGSGFVWTTDTASSVRSGYSVSTSYYLSNASTVSGDTEFESITGGTETGHTGNGYAKITWVSP